MRIMRGLALVVVASTSAAGQAPTAPAAHDVLALVRALDAAGARTGWPGFDASQWPVAVFDGEQTVLVRHPHPPPEFAPVPGPGVVAMQGRHPAVVANSTREIGGVRTATVVATPGQTVERVMLATVEEVFHVFWVARHPTFRPNEMARYVYPATSIDNLAGLLAEDEALARALDATGVEDAARWTQSALALRRNRVATLAADVHAYEIALEAMEGTANYAARRALGETAGRTAERLRAPRAAEDVRWRFYDSGAALCFVLDRLEPAWKVRAEATPTLALGEMVADALARRAVSPAAFTEAEAAAIRSRARTALGAFVQHQQRVRSEASMRPGARVVVRVAEGDTPFRVTRFDPIQVLVLGDGEVAHAHFLTLEREGAVIDVSNPSFTRNTFEGTIALTTAAGRHPLVGGTRQVVIVGLDAMPVLDAREGRVTITANGLRIDLPRAEVQTEGTTIDVTVRREAP